MTDCVDRRWMRPERKCRFFLSFLFIHTATAAIYTLSLHDALPIFQVLSETGPALLDRNREVVFGQRFEPAAVQDRKSTRLNSSHVEISYAVFCLKKKNRSG